MPQEPLVMIGPKTGEAYTWTPRHLSNPAVHLDMMAYVGLISSKYRGRSPFI